MQTPVPSPKSADFGYFPQTLREAYFPFELSNSIPGFVNATWLW